MKAQAFKTSEPVRGKIIALQSAQVQRDSLMEKISGTGKIVLPTAQGFECLNIHDILYLKAQSNYTEIHTLQRKWLFSKTLKSIESLLPQKLFCRVHKSYVVNVACVKSYFTSADDAHLILENEVSIPVSRSARARMK